MTTRGLGPDEMEQIAKWMKQVAEICAKASDKKGLANYDGELDKIHKEVKELALRFPVPGIN